VIACAAYATTCLAPKTLEPACFRCVAGVGGAPAPPGIGKLQDVYVDVETDEPMFGTVKEGFIGRHLTFVPLAGVTLGPDYLQVAVTAAAVKAAPNIELHGDELSRAEESKLYHQYELNYTAPSTEGGRRLARR
jgi:hypothetical protein